MPAKIIKVNEVDILLKKSERARYLSISVKPFAIVKITIPARLSFYEGEKLAYEKIKWIEEHIGKMRKYESQNSLYDGSPRFHTRNHHLELKAASAEKISVKVKNGLIIIKHPLNKDVKSAEVQRAIRKGIENAYKEEAKEYLPKRLNDLSDRYLLPFNELFIKNIKSRWGSCSGRNNINLSIHLMRLPDHLIDYVLLHELTHTKIKNHSKKFWNFLDTLTGNAKVLDKELKYFKINLR